MHIIYLHIHDGPLHSTPASSKWKQLSILTYEQASKLDSAPVH